MSSRRYKSSWLLLVLVSAATPAFAFDAQGFLNSMKGFAEAAIPLVSVLAFAAGVYFFGSTALNVVNAQRGQGPLSHSDGGVKVGPLIVRLFIAACLFSFGIFMSKTVVTLFNDEVSYRSALAYAPVAQISGNPIWQLAWGVCVVWVVLFGVVGMFRGLLLWNSATTESQSNGDLFWRGLWHIVGGAAAVNIGVFFT